jgi:hypothetical protein
MAEPPKPMKPQSPHEYLSQHEISREMLRLGVSKAQLDAIKFRSARGLAFDYWSLYCPNKIPESAIPLLKAYCTLKWLTLEDPPYSRDKEDAFRLVRDVTIAVRDVTIAPLIASAVKARVAQRANSERGAAARRMYSPTDHVRWQEIASERAIALLGSKVQRARLVAKRLGLPPAAVDTIRRIIS